MVEIIQLKEKQNDDNLLSLVGICCGVLFSNGVKMENFLTGIKKGLGY
ncbi:MAG: hypothetical protein PHQ03_07435 [Methylococcales bacterium]|nr:hypothetical protein [Methylococcales bacterium]